MVPNRIADASPIESLIDDLSLDEVKDSTSTREGFHATPIEQPVAAHNQTTDIYTNLQLRGPRSVRLLKIVPSDTTSTLEVELSVSDLAEDEEDEQDHDYKGNETHEDPLHRTSIRSGIERSCTISDQDVELPSSNETLYEALSYVWGPPHPRTDIVCNGQPFTVTQNLGLALIELRRTHVSKNLWIDAICINQNDLDERSSQVSLMSKIYSHAAAVVIWLGADDGTLAQSMPLVGKLANRFREICHEVDFEVANLVAISEETYASWTDLPPVGHFDWDELVNLFHREWFNRIWVIQELAKAKQATVRVGDYQAPWLDLAICSLLIHWRAYVTLAGPFHATVATAFSKVTLLNTVQNSGWIDLQTWLAIGANSHFGASDPRDKIYALLGLTSKEDIVTEYPLPQVDYRREVKIVYGDVVRHFISSTGHLDILMQSLTMEEFDEPLEEFPSWIPRWDSHKPSFMLFAYNLTEWCTASKDTLATLGETQSSDIIFLKGIELFTITKTIYQYDKSSESISVLFNEVQAELQEIPSPYPSLKDAFAVSITAGFYKAESVDDNPPVDFNGADLDAFLAKEDDAMSYAIRSQILLFITSTGYIGIGLPRIEEGDVVCIIYGSTMPCVLRPVDKHYNFVGQCYVPGIMHGEALDLFDAGNLGGYTERWFELR